MCGNDPLRSAKVTPAILHGVVSPSYTGLYPQRGPLPIPSEEGTPRHTLGSGCFRRTRVGWGENREESQEAFPGEEGKFQNLCLKIKAMIWP